MPRHSRRSAAPHLTALVAALALASACSTGAIRERLRPASPRDRYVQSLETAGLTGSALGRDWVAAGERAIARPAQVPLPARESGFFAAGEATAVAYQVRPRRGERLVVRIQAEADSGVRVFADLFEQPADTARGRRLVATSDSLRATFEVDADDVGVSYVLRLQPELLRPVRYAVTFQTAASLAFPVEGRDSRAVRSFWGADRDGGARTHEGIDIFAPRGTPAVAGADGVVRRVGESGLGGNVVFLYVPERGQSLYYAHLDRQTVQTGQRVRAGDTLGLVGNTGNARTTAPHLHFGIYRRGEGPVDPFPFVDTRRPGAPPLGRDSALVGRVARTTRDGVPVRAGPSDGSAAVRSVPRHTVVAVDGAAAGGWVRVRLPDQSSGYVPASAVEPAERPLRRERLAVSAAMRARPEPGAPAVHVVEAAGDAPVYGRFGDFVLVELDGRRGWLSLGD